MKFIVDNRVNDYDLVLRTWRERLLTLPWKPWRKFNSVYSPKCYLLNDGTVIVSAITYTKILSGGKDGK